MVTLRPLELALIAAAGHIAGALIFIRIRRIPDRFRYVVLALSAGFLISLVFLDLLPPALAWGPQGPLACLAGFFVVLGLQVWLDPSMIHTHHVEEHPAWLTDVGHAHHLTRGGRWVIPVLVGLSIHSLFDGILLESAYDTRAALGMKAFWAVFVHKVPVSLTLTAVLLTLGVRYILAFAIAVGLGFMTVLGLFVMHFLAPWAGYGLALAAGSLLYVTTVEFVPIVYHAPGRFYVVLALAGVLAGWFVV